MDYINREVIVTTQVGKKYQGYLVKIAPDSHSFLMKNVRIISPPSDEVYDVLMFVTAQCSAMRLVHPTIDPLQSLMKTCDDKVADTAVIYSLKNEVPVYQKTQGIIQGMFESTSSPRRGPNRFNHHNNSNNNNYPSHSNSGSHGHSNSGSHGYNNRNNNGNHYGNNRGNNARSYQNENNNKSYSNKRRSNLQTQSTQTQRNNQNQNQKGNKNKTPSSPSKSVRFQDQVLDEDIRRVQRPPQIPAKFVRETRNHNNSRRSNNSKQSSRGGRHSDFRRDNKSAKNARPGMLEPKIDAATGEAVKLAIDDNFDFDEAMELFRQLSTEDKKELEDAVNAEKATGKCYDKDSSFFDKLSSDAAREMVAKLNRSAEAQRDMQTFGETAYKRFVRHRGRFPQRKPKSNKRKFVQEKQPVPRQVGTQDKADAEQNKGGKSVEKETEKKETKEDKTPDNSMQTNLAIPEIVIGPASPSPIPISC